MMVHHVSALAQWSAIIVIQMNGPMLQKWALGVVEQVSKQRTIFEQFVKWKNLSNLIHNAFMVCNYHFCHNPATVLIIKLLSLGISLCKSFPISLYVDTVIIEWGECEMSLIKAQLEVKILATGARRSHENLTAKMLMLYILGIWN